MRTRLSVSLITAIFCLSAISNAQVTMYGVTSAGGAYGVGTVFSITPAGDFNVIANLNSTYAAIPEGSLLYASDGNFYATSVDGGYADSCTVFRCSPNGMLKTMINLDSVWGSSEPQGNSLIQGKDGSLYGMTTMGGGKIDSIYYSSYGVIFKLQLSGQYSALHFFNDTDGASPFGGLLQTADGYLWGMTSGGGTYGLGTIFKCSTSGVFTSVYSFDTNDGTMPHGDLILANDGNFYGLTLEGGANDFGTIFRYNPTTDIFTKLADFTMVNGANPYGKLIQATDGNLYGMTFDGAGGDSVIGYGTIFKCTLSGNLTTLVTFDDSNNGAFPMGSLTQASDGLLYGMASGGGKYGFGTIFQCTLEGSLTKIFDFDYTRATPMYGSLLEVDSLKGTGVPVNNLANGINVYPNPNDGIFTIACHMQPAASLPTVVVYNMLGEKVYSGALDQLQGNNKVNLANQPAGIYLYRVFNVTGNLLATGKITIEK